MIKQWHSLYDFLNGGKSAKPLTLLPTSFYEFYWKTFIDEPFRVIGVSGIGVDHVRGSVWIDGHEIKLPSTPKVSGDVRFALLLDKSAEIFGNILALIEVGEFTGVYQTIRPSADAYMSFLDSTEFVPTPPEGAPARNVGMSISGETGISVSRIIFEKPTLNSVSLDSFDALSQGNFAKLNLSLHTRRIRYEYAKG